MTARAAALLTCIAAAAPAAAQKVTKETFEFGRGARTYYLFVPERPSAAPLAPLIVLLHGSGRDGKSLMDKWEPLAKKEGIILAAPDSLNRAGWSMRDDGPDFLYTLVEMLRVNQDVDSKRIYLFGHSAGAIHALGMAVLESEYFAAVAVHAGAMNPDYAPYIERAPRKTPIGIWIGTNDALFPLATVRATRDAFNSRGFAAQLIELHRHTHWYYDRAPEINRQAWEFLGKAQLEGEPKFQRYAVQ